MTNATTPTQGTEAKPTTEGEGAPPNEEKKEAEHPAPHPHHHAHHHHHHEPRIIHPASSGTSHLDPGAVVIKP